MPERIGKVFRELARAIQNVIERSQERYSFRRMFAMLFNDMFTCRNIQMRISDINQ